MKTRSDIETALKQLKPALVETYKVKEIGIFGSYVKGQESEGSDVDILVAFDGPIGWEFIDLKDFLEETLSLKIDLVTTGALKPQLKEKILKEVEYV